MAVSGWGAQEREIPASKGHRIILAHAGSRNQRLITNSELVFQSHSKDSRDYHKEMNGEVFRNWLVDAILPSLDRPSCLVMDNASYHNTVSQEDKTPTSSSSKRELIELLHKENIPFSEHSLKPELLSQVKKYRRLKTYQIDKIIQLFGHTTIRLPPYHCHLNPIELVWVKVKGTVAREKQDIQAVRCERVDSCCNKRCWQSVFLKMWGPCAKTGRRILAKRRPLILTTSHDNRCQGNFWFGIKLTTLTFLPIPKFYGNHLGHRLMKKFT